MPVLLPFILSGQSERSENVVYELRKNIPYVEAEKASDAYRKKRCKLDFYYPKDVKAFPTVVWFHGGGLRAGRKEIPKSLKKKGLASLPPITGFSRRPSVRNISKMQQHPWLGPSKTLAGTGATQIRFLFQAIPPVDT